MTNVITYVHLHNFPLKKGVSQRVYCNETNPPVMAQSCKNDFAIYRIVQSFLFT